MCTVTAVPLATGLRLACNRDESPTRPAALPPAVRRFGERLAVLPIDPVSGGTWIAANDAGLAFALLNRNPRAPFAGAKSPSRGTIIPRLLGADTLLEAMRLATRIAREPLAPFRLVLANMENVTEIAGGGGDIPQVRCWTARTPLLFTSSGLGDDVVESVRRPLFRETLRDPLRWAAQQDLFHRHAWPDREEVSVCMSRPEAQTVSHTVAELSQTAARLVYCPQPPNRDGASFCVSLDLAILERT
jgi:hypothetical protein